MEHRLRWGNGHCMRVVTCVLAIAVPAALAAAPQQRLTADVTTDPAAAEFVYEDVERFIATMARIAAGGDAAVVLQRDYLDRASPGLEMFIDKYDLTAERLSAAMEKHPQKYAAIATNLEVLRSEEAVFREVYGKIKEVVPDAVFPPTYFVVAGHRGIGSGSIEGPLISIEKKTAESIRSDLAATLVHEMIHMEQLAALDEAYFEIFNGPKRTLLALCVREGIATYFSELVTGGSSHKNEARDYVLAHEKELWAAFEQEMLGSETSDWLWRQPANPDQPQDVGYALGARITEAYYQNASNKRQAIREILSVIDYRAFLARSAYVGE